MNLAFITQAPSVTLRAPPPSRREAHLGVPSLTEILIFLDYYKRDVEGAVPYRWILNLCRHVGERLAAPETKELR